MLPRYLQTMRMVLENNKRVHMLKSDLHAIMDISKKAPPGHPGSADDLEKNTEKKCNPPSATCFIRVFGIYWGLAWSTLI